jgi:hypothetical protein
MAYKPIDFFNNLIPEDTNIFGASPNPNAKIMQEMGLLDENAIQKAKKQSVFQGLLNAGLAYAAQPKNQGYGSVFPYLAKAGLAGVQAAQSPYDNLSRNAMNKAQLEEMKRNKDMQESKDLFRKNYPLTGSTTQIDPNQKVPFSPGRIPSLQDDTIGSSLMNNIGYKPEMLPNGQIAPTEVAPNYKVEDINPMDALNFGVSKDQLKTKETAPNKELMDAERAYKAGVLNYPELAAEKNRINESLKPDIKSVDPTHDVWRNGKLWKKGVPKNELSNTQKEYNQALQGGYLGSIFDYQKDLKIAGQGNTTVTVNGTESFLQTQAGKDVIKLRDSAVNIGNNMKKIDDTVELLYRDISGPEGRKVYTGAAAELQKEIARLSDAIRNVRESSPKLTETQLLDQALNSDVFPLIKQLGIGARGMDTVAERQFLVRSMIGDIAMTPEALLRATLTRRNRMVKDALMFNKEFDSDAFEMARRTGNTGFDRKFDTRFIRGPIVGDFTSPKYPGKKFQKFANGDMRDVDTGEIIEVSNPYLWRGNEEKK